MRTMVWAIGLVLAGGCFTDSGGTAGVVTTSGTSTGAGTTPTSSGGDSGVGTSTGVGTGSTGEEPTGTTTLGSEGKACDPWAQDCGAGLKCAPYASDGGDVWDANKCVPVGVGGTGASCKATDSPTSGYDSCGPGSICWDVDADTLIGVCYALCMGEPDMPVCPIGSACSMTNKGAVNVCLADCDPLTNVCPEGQVCVPDGDDQFLCLTAGGTVPPGTPCEYVNECATGSMCANSQSAAICDPQSPFCCLPFCSLKDPMCPTDLVCQSYFTDGMAPAEHADLGLCQDPV
jgi:hypothetical protein